MSIYNELQNLYTKEILQKVPGYSAGSQRRLDFPTGGTFGCCTTIHIRVFRRQRHHDRTYFVASNLHRPNAITSLKLNTSPQLQER